MFEIEFYRLCILVVKHSYFIEIHQIQFNDETKYVYKIPSLKKKINQEGPKNLITFVTNFPHLILGK